MNSKNVKNIILTILISVIFVTNVYAQKDTQLNNQGNVTEIENELSEVKEIEKKDTAQFSSTIDLIRKMGKEEISRLIKEANEKKIHSRQLELLNNLESEFNKAEEIFKRGIDTVSLNVAINKIEGLYNTASEGILTDELKIQTMRNLNTSSLLMYEISVQLDQYKKKAENYLALLVPIKNRTDSIQTDSLLLWFSTDSTLFMEYFNEVVTATIDLGPLDSNLTVSIINLNDILRNINSLHGKITTGIELIEEYKKQLAGNMFSDEKSDKNNSDIDTVSFQSSFEFSKTKANLVLKYYLTNNFWRIILLLSVITILIYFTFIIRKRFKNNLTEDPDLAKLVFNHPLLSPVFISLIFLQFIFPHPPVLFTGILWTMSSVILTIILWKYFSIVQKVIWIYFVSAFATVLFLDLQLRESLFEKWIMIIVTFTATITVIIALKKKVLWKENNKVKFFFLIFSFLLLIGSLVSILTGKYNLPKMFLTLCFFGLLSAYLLYWAWILFTQLLNVGVESYKSEGNQNFKDKVQKLKTSIPDYLRMILIAGWAILVARNFYFYERITGEITRIIEQETSIGDFTFTFEKLILFIFIIMLATAISKLISLFSDRFDNSESRYNSSNLKAGGLSNWMLLIRIAVISVGTLLAFAATGIPIDKMTIIIGSLGVGIGLGLQSIVNNLVSGIILAFEKPFKIGDYIDVSDESGRIKEIGIRSSKLSTSDGADIIIPNGDLLSKHVINWTLRDSLKRSEFTMNIKYGSNLNEIISILKNSMNNNERIEKYPQPDVLLQKFDSGSAEYRLLFWTHLVIADTIKTELIIAIEKDLKDKGIDFKS